MHLYLVINIREYIAINIQYSKHEKPFNKIY